MTRKKGSSVKSSTSGFAASLERLKPLVPPEELPLLLAELKKPLLSAIRINLLKSSPADLQEWSRRYGWQLKPIPFCHSGFVVESAVTPISQVIEHKMGLFYIQDAASMLPVELFDFSAQSNPLILDLASSPGGKTTQLISNSADQGLVIANDSNQTRIPALRTVLQNWSAANIVITKFPGEQLGKWFPQTFDLVLLDAPCSMEGLRATDAHPLRSISDRERLSLAHRQLSLLESAVRSAKMGGQVVYSTCTLAPEEDEMVLYRLLKKYPEVIKIEKIPPSLHVKAPALADYQEIHFDPQVTNATRLWPHFFGTAGFFAARLTKINEIPFPILAPPLMELNQAGYHEMDANDTNSFSEFLIKQYGFDIHQWLEKQNLLLYRKAQRIVAIPALYVAAGITLPIQSLGMTVAEENFDGWQITHEFCSRFGKHFISGIFVLPQERVSSWLCGEDQQGLTLPKGENRLVVVFDEMRRNLGRGKILSDRLKNLLPRRLV